MSADGLRGGQIVIADWSGDALPKESNKRRPAIVVEDDWLFPASYPNVILVPLTEDPNLATPNLAVSIGPTAENGCTKRCWALAAHVTATSKRRITPTQSSVTTEQLATIRRQIAVAIGLDH